MKKVKTLGIGKWAGLSIYSTVLSLISASSAAAVTLNIGFTKLPGLTGGFPAATAVYVANLSDIGFDIGSIQIRDNSGGLGGATGKFSGFDLDGIKFSRSIIANGADINSLPGLNVFDFSSAGSFFTPGTQRYPVNPTSLFGTTGGTINNEVATLNSFDGNSTTNEVFAGPTAFGFASLGDNGKIIFNLTSLVSTTESLYLYIGEVGDNGEVGAGEITVSDKPMNMVEETPVPTSNPTVPTQTSEEATVPTSNPTVPTQTSEETPVPTSNSTVPRKSVPEPASLVSLSLLGIYLVTYRFQKTKC